MEEATRPTSKESIRRKAPEKNHPNAGGGTVVRKIAMMNRDSSPEILEEKVVYQKKKEGTAKKSFNPTRNTCSNVLTPVSSAMRPPSNGSSMEGLPNIWVESVESLATKTKPAPIQPAMSNNACLEPRAESNHKPAAAAGQSSASVSNDSDDDIEILEERPPRVTMERAQQMRGLNIITTRPSDNVHHSALPLVGVVKNGGLAQSSANTRVAVTQPRQGGYQQHKQFSVQPSTATDMAWQTELTKTYATATRTIGNVKPPSHRVFGAPQSQRNHIEIQRQQQRPNIGFSNPSTAMKSISIPGRIVQSPVAGRISHSGASNHFSSSTIQQTVNSVVNTMRSKPAAVPSPRGAPQIPYGSNHQFGFQAMGQSNGFEHQLGASVTVRSTQPLNLGQILHQARQDGPANKVPAASTAVATPTNRLAQSNHQQRYKITAVQMTPAEAARLGQNASQKKMVPSMTKVLPMNPNLPSYPKDFYARGTMGKPWIDSKADEDNEFHGQFQCEWCDAYFPTNVAFSCHALAHVLHEPSDLENEDDPSVSVEREVSASLADASRCMICFAVFRSPFDMENHFQAVHSRQKPVEAQGQNAVCYICEKSFVNVRGLMGHMHNTHKDGTDAPYWCKLCQFRTSFYEDLVYHFQKEHDGSRMLLCLMCLHVGEGQLPKVVHKKRTTVVSTKHFVAHMMQHVVQKSASKMKCERCRLVFAKDVDKTRHFRTQHVKVGFDTRHHHGMKPVSCAGFRPQLLHELDQRPLLSRRLKRPVDRPLTLADSGCVECRQPMNSEKHFRGDETACSVCEFQSNCNNSFVNHMIDHAKGLEGNPTVFRKSEPIMRVPGQCDCGFQTTLGSKLAHHLAVCQESDGTARLIPVVSSSSSFQTQSGSEEQPETWEGLPSKFLKYARLAAKRPEKDNKIEDDSEREDETLMELKLEEIRSRRQNRSQKFPSADSPESPGEEDSMLNRPHLMSPKMLRVRSGAAKSSTTPAKPVQNKRKRPSTSESDSDSDDSGEASKERMKEYKRRKLAEDELESEDPFLSRRATADAAGSQFKRYRDRAEKVGAELTGQQNQRDLDFSVGCGETEGSSVLDSVLIRIEVSSVLRSLVSKTVSAVKNAGSPSEPITVPVDSSESALETNNNGPSDPAAMDYADFLKELGVGEEGDGQGTPSPTEENRSPSPSENTLFERIENELRSSPSALIDT